MGHYAVVGLAWAVAVAPAEKDRIAAIVRQLGDKEFARREAASRELVTLGEPAVGAVRAAADKDPDPEVRERARRVLDRVAAGAAERELARWSGSWKTADGAWLKIDGPRWSAGTPTYGPNTGALWVVAVGPAFAAADMFVESGPNQGQTCRAIFRLDGDRLRYCGTYLPTRASDFRAAAGYYLAEFQRQKK